MFSSLKQRNKDLSADFTVTVLGVLMKVISLMESGKLIHKDEICQNHRIQQFVLHYYY